MKAICDKNGKELAVVLREVDYQQQIDKRFFTNPGDTLQVGSLFFPQDSSVAPHIHKKKEITEDPMEVLILLHGNMNADIYDESRQLIESVELRVGDILIQKYGGHGFRFSSKTTLLEIKLGPYHGKDSDKEMITKVSARKPLIYRMSELPHPAKRRK